MTRPLLVLAAALAALSAPAAGVARPSIPPEFRGFFDSNACRNSNEDLTLRLTAHRVAFYESEGPVLAVRRLGPRSIRVSVRFPGGDEDTHVTRLTFQLSADGQTLTNTTTRPWDPKVRCHF